MLHGRPPFAAGDQWAIFRKIQARRYTVAPKVSPEAADLISQLLQPNPARRLGTLAGREKDVYSHAVCRKLDPRRLLQREYTPPWVPQFKDSTDTSNFAHTPTSAGHAANAKKYDRHIMRAGDKHDALWEAGFGPLPAAASGGVAAAVPVS